MLTILLYEIFALIIYFGCSKCNILSSMSPSTYFSAIAYSPNNFTFLIL